MIDTIIIQIGIDPSPGWICKSGYARVIIYGEHKRREKKIQFCFFQQKKEGIKGDIQIHGLRHSTAEYCKFPVLKFQSKIQL